MEFDWLLALLSPETVPGTTPGEGGGAGAEAIPRQRMLYLRLREAVLAGRLPAGTRLPASRSLAATLGIARNTVLFAYEQLVAEGCLVADRQGTRVAPLP
ncbi:MAG TPA: winged helix-turn-helix domain-containing protein, partial [Thauera sp.]|nr:winged helix-turn-helix domain-containing protein [Thauera sp.]